MLREDQELSSAIRKGNELRLAKALLQCGQLGIVCVFPNPSLLINEFRKRAFGVD